MGFSTVGSYALLHLTAEFSPIDCEVDIAAALASGVGSHHRRSRRWRAAWSRPVGAINDAGGIAVYTPPPPIIPESMSARQFKLQLLAVELLDQVEIWIASQSQAVQIAYANSATFLRTEPMIQQGFAALASRNSRWITSSSRLRRCSRYSEKSCLRCRWVRMNVLGWTTSRGISDVAPSSDLTRRKAFCAYQGLTRPSSHMRGRMMSR